MPTEKTPNYTEEMVTKLHARYAELGNDGLETIAKELGKPVRSIRAKLVRDGIYVAPVKTATSRKAEEPSKKELLKALDETGFESAGLEGATKEALARVIALAKIAMAN